MRYWIFIPLILFFYCLGGISQNYAQVNDKVDFTLPQVLGDSTVSLADFEQHPCVVIIFVANYCPYVKSYRQRIIDLIEKYKSGTQPVQFILINPENNHDALEDLKENAQAFACPYLFDKEQIVSKQFQATRLPEAFVLQPSLGHFIVKYHGAIDNNPQGGGEVQTNYLEEAIEAILENKNPPTINQKPIGCSINN